MKKTIFLFFFVTLTQIYSGNGNPPGIGGIGLANWSSFRSLSRNGSGVSPSRSASYSSNTPTGPLVSYGSRSQSGSSGSDSPGNIPVTYRSSQPSSASGGSLIGGSGDIDNIITQLRSASGRFAGVGKSPSFSGVGQSPSVRQPPNRSYSSPPSYGSYNNSNDTTKGPDVSSAKNTPPGYGGPLPRQNSYYNRPSEYSSSSPKPPAPEPAAAPPQPKSYAPIGATAPPKPTSYSSIGGGDCGATFTQHLPGGKKVTLGIKSDGIDKETASNVEKTIRNAINQMENEYRVALVTKYS